MVTIGGGEYTLFQDSDIPSLSRIDRVLVSTDWKERFLDVTQRLLPWVVSDHCPLLMEVEGMSSGKSSFKFENSWLKVERFVDRVRQ